MIDTRKQAARRLRRRDRIRFLTKILALRSEETMAHSRRVSRLCKLIARRLGLGEARARELARAGLLHDIGKMFVDECLEKAGPLTDSERSRIENHVRDGERIIGAVLPGQRALIEDVAAHHERLSGGGYPRALRGAEIPLGARIIACADVFDALASKRSYKNGLPIEEALRIITEGIGAFDPDVVAALTAVVVCNPHDPRPMAEARS
jgi:putative two-component system response regulator